MSMSTNSSEKFTHETITWIQAWTPKLFSFRLTRAQAYRFEAGQWARLGVIKAGRDKPIWRAYSIVSATYEPYLEFYSIVVPGGDFTSELSTLAVGDTVLLEKLPYGFLTMARFETLPQQDLWLLSTGTGLAPFISVLGDLAVWEHYQRIIVVHGVRQANELTYTDTLSSFTQHELFAEQAHKLIYQACVTREAPENIALNTLMGRIPLLIDTGALENAVGVRFTPEHSRVMICGNPDMVVDTRSVLKAKGLTVSKSSQLGNIAVENYW
jgi:ferredoxin/flavodoxin---NADP+ reductase